MATLSAGFKGRHNGDAGNTDLPPGQYLTHGFPGRSVSATPHAPLDTWRLEVSGDQGLAQSRSRDEVRALDAEEVAVDLHRVTRWSKLVTTWTRIRLETLLNGADVDGDLVVASPYGGCPTNLPLDDLLHGNAWVGFEYDEEPLDPEHGGPARLLVPQLPAPSPRIGAP